MINNMCRVSYISVAAMLGKCTRPESWLRWLVASISSHKPGVEAGTVPVRPVVDKMALSFLPLTLIPLLLTRLNLKI
jgi:hypothetical protein